LKAIAVKSGSSDSVVASGEYSYSPLKSGQTLCHDSAGTLIGCGGTGHDGATQLGVARSYTNNGNGTVTDNATGLLWQKCSYGLFGGSGCEFGTLATMNWATAQTDCSALTTAGRTWRLPSRLELETLIDYGTSNPSINVANFPPTVAGLYWSSTTYASNTTNAWIFNFNGGNVSNTDKMGNFQVRCVSGDIKPTTTFTDNGDGTVKDKQSGLTWQKCSVEQNSLTCGAPGASTFQWATALTTCST
jgi:hypothetical protein